MLSRQPFQGARQNQFRMTGHNPLQYLNSSELTEDDIPQEENVEGLYDPLEDLYYDVYNGHRIYYDPEQKIDKVVPVRPQDLQRYRMYDALGRPK